MKCEIHNEINFWLQIGLPDLPENYRCSACHPPPARAFVARWAEAAADIHDLTTLAASATTPPHQRTPTPTPDIPLTQPITIAYARPICPTCACSWITEVDQRTGRKLLCWTCGREISDDALQAALARRASPP